MNNFINKPKAKWIDTNDPFHPGITNRQRDILQKRLMDDDYQDITGNIHETLSNKLKD